jgi:hypothetical protein
MNGIKYITNYIKNFNWENVLYRICLVALIIPAALIIAICGFFAGFLYILSEFPGKWKNGSFDD